MNHTLSQALKSSALCFSVNSCDSQVDVTGSPQPEATVTHNSAHFNISLLFAQACFLLQSRGLALPSEKVGHIITTLHSFSPDDSPKHCGCFRVEDKDKVMMQKYPWYVPQGH